LQGLVDRPAERRRLASAGPTRAAAFAWEKSLPRLRADYLRLVADRIAG
jgi:hypothetical protein